MSAIWEEVDTDDIAGYLLDYLEGWVKENGISDLNEFHEKFQTDSFMEEIQDLAEEVVNAVLAINKSEGVKEDE